TYHGYGIEDFLSIDPRFASNSAAPEKELLAFINAGHALGIYVIFDIVLNHTGDVFEYLGFGSKAPFSQSPRDVRWRDSDGNSTASADGAAMPSAIASLFLRTSFGVMLSSVGKAEEDPSRPWATSSRSSRC